MNNNTCHDFCINCKYGQLIDNSLFLGKIRTSRIYRCPQCKLIYVYPKLNKNEINKLYADYHELTNQYQLSKGEIWLFNYVLDYISKHKIGNELLDIGCSYGYFLDMARKRGWSTKGVEIAPYPCQYARKELKLDVECKNLTEAAFDDNSFSAITMLNVLEHMSDPFHVLAESWRISKRGGWIMIVVPNILLAYPLFMLTSKLGLNLSIPTSAYDVPFHLTLFSPDSLVNMLKSSGWKKISIINAPVIKNEGMIKTRMKITIKLIGDGIGFLTRNRFIYGYSLFAAAQKL
jgi:2-polyprenyl-3-methyl-5-hydroxy-6-metoxy-1,4-benzoquinol methylase